MNELTLMKSLLIVSLCFVTNFPSFKSEWHSTTETTQQLFKSNFERELQTFFKQVLQQFKIGNENNEENENKQIRNVV